MFKLVLLFNLIDECLLIRVAKVYWAGAERHNGPRLEFGEEHNLCKESPPAARRPGMLEILALRCAAPKGGAPDDQAEVGSSGISKICRAPTFRSHPFSMGIEEKDPFPSRYSKTFGWLEDLFEK